MSSTSQSVSRLFLCLFFLVVELVADGVSRADYVALNIPQYPSVVRKPIDLGTIRQKLEGGQYPVPPFPAFEADMRLLFKNCYLFNPPGTPVNEWGQKLEEVFNRKWDERPTGEDDDDSAFLLAAACVPSMGTNGASQCRTTRSASSNAKSPASSIASRSSSLPAPPPRPPLASRNAPLVLPSPPRSRRTAKSRATRARWPTSPRAARGAVEAEEG